MYGIQMLHPSSKSQPNRNIENSIKNNNKEPKKCYVTLVSHLKMH